MVRMYELNEVHECTTCGLALQVSFAAVPVMPVTCCGKEMEFLGVIEDTSSIDPTPKALPENPKEKIYKKGEKYYCEICGIEVVILRQGQPEEQLDCCGEGMDLVV